MENKTEMNQRLILVSMALIVLGCGDSAPHTVLTQPLLEQESHDSSLQEKEELPAGMGEESVPTVQAKVDSGKSDIEVEWRGSRLSHFVNTQLDEYLPVIDEQQGLLYFTGMDRTGFFDFKLNITEQVNSGGEDIWVANVNGPNQGDARPLTTMNTRGHEAVTDHLEDGSLLVVANYPENMSPASASPGVETTDLFRLKNKGGQWRIEHIPEPINSIFTESDAHYVEEQGALLFVSDRPGHIGEYHKKGWKWNDGYWGNTDVWVAKWDLRSGRVSGLIHLPEPINTAGAERTPWLSDDGLHLYLSSNGADGEGPLRVLRFTRPDRNSWEFWSGPEEIGIDGISDGDIWGFSIQDEATAWCAASFPLGFTRSQITGGGDAGSFRETNLRGGYDVTGRQVASINASREFDVLRLVRPDAPDFLLEDILFQSGSDVLADEAASYLDLLADRCAVNFEYALRIEGHADAQGSEQMNVDLSRRRAESIRDALKSRGVSNPIQVRAFGESVPLTSNDTDRGRSMNRRVEVYFDQVD
jgi:outer membrane protein OmpA-like peptidoglycan-associated protein